MRDFKVEPASDAMAVAAEDFFRLLYVEHDFITAMRTHTSASFVEHNPDLPNDPEDQARFFEERHSENPEFFASEKDWNTRFSHRFIVGKYLIVHYFMSVGPTDRGRMFADFWRWDDDKIVEHWDVVQPIPEETVSGNPMW